MKNIRDEVLGAVNRGESIEFCNVGVTAGVMYQSEFIPFSDLGYNRKSGFFKISENPDKVNSCDRTNLETVHMGNYDDWDGYVWSDSGGTLHLLGEKWQIADLHEALTKFLVEGEYDPEVVEPDDPAWGETYSIAGAVIEAMDYLPHLFADHQVAADTIRSAARRGSVPGAYKLGDRWVFHRRKFRGWLVRKGQQK